MRDLLEINFYSERDPCYRVKAPYLVSSDLSKELKDLMAWLGSMIL